MSNELNIAAIEGDPERTICLVLTPSRMLSDAQRFHISQDVRAALAKTKWRDLPFFIADPGWKLEAVELTKEQAAAMQAKPEAWRDREAML